MLVILAGNAAQADFFASEHGFQRRDYMYASSVESLKGLGPYPFVRTGTWYERKDRFKLQQELYRRGIKIIIKKAS